MTRIRYNIVTSKRRTQPSHRPGAADDENTPSHPARYPSSASPAPPQLPAVGILSAVQHQATLDAGADPQTVAEWTRQVKAERAAALARDASQTRRQTSRQLTQDDIRALITSLSDLRDVIRAADPAMKAAIYAQLGLKVTYLPGQDKLRANVTISPEKFLEQPDQYGVMGSVRGGTQRLRTCPRSPVS
jgi:hypothetical protein